jgi:hypothetical protein
MMGVGHQGSGENTMAGVQTFLEAFLNILYELNARHPDVLLMTI